MVDNKAVAYVRVSSAEQSLEGVSLDAQIARIQAYAAMRGFDLVAIFREEAVSGGIPLRERPQGALLVEAVAKKRAQHVIAVKLDRLFRNASDALLQVERWEKAKQSLHVIDMGGSAIDTSSAMGKLFFSITAAFAEMERNVTKERTKAALNHLKQHGRAYTRIVPFGFDRSGDALVENVAEMATVRRIQALRQSGLSLIKIANMLTVEGVPTKQGGQWRQATIDSVLKVHATIDK
jgi:site-specific DNA recombinase